MGWFNDYFNPKSQYQIEQDKATAFRASEAAKYGLAPDSIWGDIQQARWASEALPAPLAPKGLVGFTGNPYAGIPNVDTSQFNLIGISPYDGGR